METAFALFAGFVVFLIVLAFKHQAEINDLAGKVMALEDRVNNLGTIVTIRELQEADR